MKADPPGPGIRFLRKRGPMLVAAVLFAAGLFAMYRLLEGINPQDILQRIRSIPAHVLALADGATVFGYAALAGYDWSAIRYVGRRLPLSAIGLTSFIGFALSNTLGMGALTGAAVRYRLYSRLGLEPDEIAVVSAFCATGFGLGVLVVGGTALIAHPEALAGMLPVPPAAIRWASALALVAVVGIIATGIRGGLRLRLGDHSVRLPGSGLLLGQVLFSVLDIGFAGATLYVLLPGNGPSFPDFLVIFSLAAVTSVISHVPGGIGVFESVILAAMPPTMSSGGVAAALLVYRVIYYLLPFTAAFVLLVLGELIAPLRKRGLVEKAGLLLSSSLAGTAHMVLPTAAAGMAFVSGLLLLLRPALPLAAETAQELETLFPLAFVEISNLLGSVVGIILIVLSHGLWRRIRSAMWFTVALSLAGAVFSFGQGLDLDRPFILVAVAAFLILGRHSFWRHARLFSRSMSSVWILASGAALLALVWLLLFSYKATPYGHELWWEFAFDKQSPRGMRTTVSATATVLILYIAAALRLPRPRAALPDPETLARVEDIIRDQDNADANLALTGDKMVMLSDSGKSFVMYGIRGRSYIALGDPIGLSEEAPDLVWSFKEQALEQGGRAAFYQVAASHLDWYADAGFVLHKTGEEARVPLPRFGLEGSHRRRLRQSHHRALRDGLRFSLIEPPANAELIGSLKQISDAWLKAKNAREKAFSLGRFDPDYLRRFPLALVYWNRKLTAFANVLVTETKAEATIDLMRHLPDASPATMDFLFTELMLALRQQGFAEFNLGMAPLAGLSDHPYARTWDRLGSFLFRYGGHFYNFSGLRDFKDKFDPIWRAKYLATSSSLDPYVVSIDIAALVNGGLSGSSRT